MSGLLETKLHCPSLPPKRVQRARLIQRLNEGLEAGRQITLVSAPAGFGKSTCIGEWVNALDRLPVTWLSLDPADDDPGRFFSYFIAALQKVEANLAKEIQAVMHSGQLPSGEIISAALINDLLELENRFLLVIDDFHVIQDRFILAVLERLLSSLPETLHLVLLSREDPPLPLARLRANNQLTEIRAGDLRFTQDEADRYLNEVMTLSLSQADIAVLEGKTEGWIVGLQLAAIAMQSQPAALSIQARNDPSSFIATLSGSHRFILSYLTEQVLNQQPEEIRNFLLQTSILDQLNGDLCDAVTGRSDSHVLLEQLFNANLFLIPLDDERHWYRYHHLFVDLLRDLQNSLQKDKTAELHRRASRWYAKASVGEGKAFVSEAIQHALEAQDYQMAVDLLESHALELIMQGYARTVNAWFRLIPAEWSWKSPRTNLALAWMYLLLGAYPQAIPYLERLEGTFSGSKVSERERQSLKAEWLVMQSLRMNMEGKMAESLAMADEALEIAPQEDNRLQSLVYFGVASAHQALDDYGFVVNAYQKAIQHGRAAKNSVAEMLSISGLAGLAIERGQLHLAFEIVNPVKERVEGSGSPPPISTLVYGILGEVYYQWVQIEQARRYFLHALQLSTLGGVKSGMINCRVLLSRLLQLEGDLPAAACELQQALDMLQADTPDYVRQEALSQQVRVCLARNHPDVAEMALQGQGFSSRDRFSFPNLSQEGKISHSIGLLYNSSLCLLLYRARVGHDLAGVRAGVKFADQVVHAALLGQYIPVALEALLLRAQMHAVLDDHPASQADYIKALELAEPQGFIGVFIEQGPPVASALADLLEHNRLGTVHPDYVRRILAVFPVSRSYGIVDNQPAPQNLSPGGEPGARIEADTLVEPLTTREQEVLRLMANGLKYKEIAARLFISLNTVRFHVKSIYGKLHVNNRMQAIEKARQLRIS